MLLHDAYPNLCRLLKQGTREGPSDESGSLFNNNSIYMLAGLGVALVLGFCCCFCLSVLGSDGHDVNWEAPTLAPRRVRASEVIVQWSSTLAQRKHATLEIFRTSQVTMKVTDDDIHKATEEQCSEDLEFGVEGGTLILSRAVAADDDSTANASYSAPPETAPNCCAICLESYQPGEVVAWSCSCKHVFHQDCIAHYLSKKMFGGETPCPCCRQQFLKWPDDDDPLEPKT